MPSRAAWALVDHLDANRAVRAMDLEVAAARGGVVVLAWRQRHEQPVGRGRRVRAVGQGLQHVMGGSARDLAGLLRLPRREHGRARPGSHGLAHADRQGDHCRHYRDAADPEPQRWPAPVPAAVSMGGGSHEGNGTDAGRRASGEPGNR